MALDYSIIGNRIKTIRKKKKITQATLAEALDVSDSTISRIERGDLKLSLSRLNQICEVLEVKELLGHSSLKTTEKYYIFVFPEDKANTIELINDFISL